LTVARTIGGVSFDGTANIVPDTSKGAKYWEGLQMPSVGFGADGWLRYHSGLSWATPTCSDVGAAPASHTHAESDVTNLTTDLGNKVTANGAITGATKTKITYDSKGLVTAGADATYADVGALAAGGTAVDADKLDGQHGSYYAPAAHGVTQYYIPYAATPTTWGNGPYWDAVNGRMHIGGSNPTALLSIGNDTHRGTVNIYGYGRSKPATLGIFDDSTNGHHYTFYNGDIDIGPGSLALYDNTKSAWRFAIDSTGKFGIGITVPTNKLTVSGGILADTVLVDTFLDVNGSIHAIGDIYTTALTDWAGSADPQGFSSGPAPTTSYKKIGKTVILSFGMLGESNSSIFTFTLPYAANSISNWFQPMVRITDNGVSLTTPGSVYLNGTTCYIYVNCAGNGFTDHGEKGAHGVITYEAQ
jgi:hypothetical protein